MESLSQSVSNGSEDWKQSNGDEPLDACLSGAENTIGMPGETAADVSAQSGEHIQSLELDFDYLLRTGISQYR